ncbi:isocitrate lyase/PEP mutase family protein [Parapusillimonas granuli]|uniref:Isocitrate lyase/phosphoenolpyruvate mutase family protein n=1 Tax=Parapusillimonas granuli TaxID=380911 RepID=A0A853FWQ1_9BURK|nr:isocitrate lyase/phosphoenolpyruvate mutase family protein [Parapusillimonas granuli]MBB5213743.1 2-methylisocitrate lyase-like PEP mutase family enzyme [Parapusillimonas granuli]MEB2398819.1 isocitrate lyase/phosphoenolpyruvate mutase family protein [Alcaligenaceae bacterium]NYT48577.1 isocitrate lyase/phosphoenolpyruvate mutase family protein [Parapusillimonas granuli]
MTDTDGTARKRDLFFQLHEAGCFVIPNPWNVGTARCLQDLGFKAIASTSAGHAHANGLPDGAQGLDEVLAHYQALAAAVDIPLNADFENGFAEDPQGLHDNVVRCVATGVAGLSIEDAPQGQGTGLYDFPTALARIKAARAAIDQTGRRVLLTARSEGFIRGAPDLAETVRRLRAYAQAGADCLYAPGIKTKEEIAAVVQAADGLPVNFLNSAAFGYTVDDLARMGVRRISVGGTLARLAMDGFLQAAQRIARQGSFDDFAGVVSNAELNQRFEKYAK